MRVGGREVGGDDDAAAARWQAVGRTAGDLIVAVEAEHEAAARTLNGRIQRVAIEAARPLLLTGRLVFGQ